VGAEALPHNEMAPEAPRAAQTLKMTDLRPLNKLSQCDPNWEFGECGEALVCYALFCYPLLCYALLCFAMLCFAFPCYALPCFAMLCHALRCLCLEEAQRAPQRRPRKAQADVGLGFESQKMLKDA